MRRPRNLLARKDSALQPDCHAVLYLKLAEVTNRVQLSLREADPDMLMSLAEEQAEILEDILKAGLSQDSQIIDIVSCLRDQVADVITEIGLCKLDVSEEIKKISDGKKLIHAYGG